MPVQNRIKILKVNSYEEAENKVNDFLAFDKDIVQLVNIDYRLEYNFVIIEYYIMMDHLDNNNNENNKMMGLGDYSYMYDNPLITSWWKLYLHSFSY